MTAVLLVLLLVLAVQLVTLLLLIRTARLSFRIATVIKALGHALIDAANELQARQPASQAGPPEDPEGVLRL